MGKKEKKREGKRVKNEYKIMLTKEGENGKRRKEERELKEEMEGRHFTVEYKEAKGRM